MEQFRLDPKIVRATENRIPAFMTLRQSLDAGYGNDFNHRDKNPIYHRCRENLKNECDREYDPENVIVITGLGCALLFEALVDACKRRDIAFNAPLNLPKLVERIDRQYCGDIRPRPFLSIPQADLSYRRRVDNILDLSSQIGRTIDILTMQTVLPEFRTVSELAVNLKILRTQVIEARLRDEPEPAARKIAAAAEQMTDPVPDTGGHGRVVVSLHEFRTQRAKRGPKSP